MIIEFFGMPGAGKTSAARRIAQEFGFEIIHIDNTFELILRNILFSVTHPVRTSKLFVYLIQHTDRKSFWYKFTNLFLHPNAKYQKASAYKRALIDQGNYQTVISLFETKQSAAQIHKITHNMFQPDFLFLFTINAATRSERLTHRHYVVRERDGEEAFLERLAVMDYHFQMFVNQPEHIHTAHTVIDSTVSKDKVYTSVANTITKLTI